LVLDREDRSPTLDDRELIDHLEQALLALDPRTQDVIRRRLVGCHLGAIGDDLGLTKERIRQIEQRGLEDLRKRTRHLQPR
jgi:RNA polymerase sigma factor (sigma-70 family)